MLAALSVIQGVRLVSCLVRGHTIDGGKEQALGRVGRGGRQEVNDQHVRQPCVGVSINRAACTHRCRVVGRMSVCIFLPVVLA